MKKSTREKIPVLLRRVQFMCHKQEEGKDSIPWRVDLRNLADYAAIQGMDMLDTLRHLCHQCQIRRTSQQHNPRTTALPSAAFGGPMAHVGLHIFDFAGKKHLICVDRWSGFPLYKRLNSTSTQSVINALETWFKS